VFFFGLAAITIIGGGELLFPNKPITIVVVIGSILLVSLTSIGDYGIQTVGAIPRGLPKLHFPAFRFEDLMSVTPLAFACFLLAYIESVSTGRTLGQKNGYDIDARQEMLALGFANLATSLGSGYPVSGGLSQSAVNDGAGAKTPMSLIIASFTIALCLLFLTGMLQNLPSVLLACIVLVAIKSLINIKEFKHLWKINRQDFYIAIIALIGVIVFGILKGVIIASIASLLLIIKIVSTPNIAVLGRIPGTTRYSDFKRHIKNEPLPHLLLFRVEAPILYFNVNNIYNAVFDHIAAYESELKVVIMDLSTSAYIDSSGAKFIKKLYSELDELGISFRLAEAHSEARDILRDEDAEDLFGKISRRDSLHDVVTNCLLEHHEWEQEKMQEQNIGDWYK
jgi:MFS superfamily sulfate permease-like transporter